MSKPFTTATIATEISPGNQYGHVNIYINAVHLPDGETGGERTPWDHKANGFYCDNLVISCQVDKDDTANGKPYGFRVGYSKVHFLQLNNALDAAKTLAKIDRELNKLREEWGSTQSFGEYVQRICRILKIKRAKIGAAKCLPERVGAEADRIALDLIKQQGE